MNILRLDRVLKTFDKYAAVNYVSFDVKEGSIFGLLGPNGAGKTTIIRMITTITAPDEGVIYLHGQPLAGHHPAQIGYMPEERGLYKKMKVGEQLVYLAQLKDMAAADAKAEIKRWFEKFEITDWWDKKVEELSKGMQQKIQFIATILHRPKLIILDEPFTGLDPINTILLKDEITELHRQGTSIIFSTHRMEQVEEMCQHIVLINKGLNVLDGEVTDIQQQYKQNLFHFQFQGDLPEGFREKTKITEQKPGEVTVQLDPGHDSNSLLRHLLDKGVHVVAFNEILPNFNEIFIRRVEETES